MHYFIYLIFLQKCNGATDSFVDCQKAYSFLRKKCQQMLNQFACFTWLKLSMISLRSLKTLRQSLDQFSFQRRARLIRLYTKTTPVARSNFTLLLYHVRERKLIKTESHIQWISDVLNLFKARQRFRRKIYDSRCCVARKIRIFSKKSNA